MSRFKSLLKAGLLVSLLSFIGGGASFAQTATAESSNAPTALRGPEQRVALVIGNSNYQNAPDLANPGNDARSMAQLPPISTSSPIFTVPSWGIFRGLPEASFA